MYICTMEQNVKRAAKYMSLLLRHCPEKEGLIMDKFGWVMIKQLIKVLNITKDDLDEIVKEDNKQRFSFDTSKTKIRASQGHSIAVDTQPTETKPPDILYHGTATRFLDSIYKTGINKGKRNHLHLSDDKETATTVGSRHGTLYILEIDTKQMYKDGYKFYLSKNKVWLTDSVPTQYIKQ
jgi:putative RNA 2'-phosphotransferase